MKSTNQSKSSVLTVFVLAFGTQSVGTKTYNCVTDQVLRHFEELNLVGGENNVGKLILEVTGAKGQITRNCTYELVRLKGGNRQIVDSGRIFSADTMESYNDLTVISCDGDKSLTWTFVVSKSDPGVVTMYGKVTITGDPFRFSLTPKVNGEPILRTAGILPSSPHSSQPKLTGRSALPQKSAPPASVPRIATTTTPVPPSVPRPSTPAQPVPVVSAKTGSVSTQVPAHPRVTTPTTVPQKQQPKPATKTKLPVPKTDTGKSAGEVRDNSLIETLGLIPVSEIVQFLPGVYKDEDGHEVKFPGQPRTYFDEEGLSELVESMKDHGQLQPITVTRLSEDELKLHPGKKYKILMGERRFRAVMERGGTHISAVVRKCTDIREAHLAALAENFIRKGHTIMELSNALMVQSRAGTSVNKLCGILKITRTYYYNVLGLQNLVPELQKLLNPSIPYKEGMRSSYAMVLSQIDPAMQVKVWDEVKVIKRKKVAFFRLKELALQYPRPKDGETPSPRKVRPSDVLHRALSRILSAASFVALAANDGDLLKAISEIALDDKEQVLSRVVDPLDELIALATKLRDSLKDKT